MQRCSFSNRPSFTKSILYLVAILATSSPLSAHNGPIALAQPVAGIVVDGSFNDWPEDLKSYPIALPEYGSPPVDAADLSASFRVGYDPTTNTLSLAIEVADDSIVIDTTAAATWDTQDGCDFYIDFLHQPEGSPAIQHAIYGEQSEKVAGPAKRPAVNLVQQRGTNWHRYECSVPLGTHQRADITPWASIGFDLRRHCRRRTPRRP